MEMQGLSILEQKIMEFDTEAEHLRWSPDDYIHHAIYEMPTDWLKALIIQDITWRASHGRNVLADCWGGSGTGKSLFMSALGLTIGELYGVPFGAQDVFFNNNDLDESFQHAKKRSTKLKDEESRTRAGYMAKIIDSQLTDYENQIRKYQVNLLFASVEEQDHSSFFKFVAKHTFFDETGFPTGTRAVLLTPRYTNTHEFVWRGFIDFKCPPLAYLNAYDLRKDEHLQKLKAKYGNSLDPIPNLAKDILKKRGSELIKETREGYIRPIKEELMHLILADEIGTQRFSIAVNRILIAKVRELIDMQYARYNEEKMEQVEKAREEEKEQALKKEQEKELKAQERRAIKEQRIAERMRLEKERLELKKKAIELKQKEGGNNAIDCNISGD